jgi:hypothetical protein
MKLNDDDDELRQRSAYAEKRLMDAEADVVRLTKERDNAREIAQKLFILVQDFDGDWDMLDFLSAGRWLNGSVDG